jgi:signal transduction histidine kinase/DNA-binding response OmpR family regulator
MIKVLLTILVLIPSVLHARLGGKLLIDSMIAALPRAKEDTNKVLLLNKISFVFQNINPDQGVAYGTRGLQLASNLKWDKGIAFAANAIGVNYLNKADYDRALQYITRSLAINEAREDKKAIAANLGNIANIYQVRGDLPNALECQFKTLKIAEALNNGALIASCLMNIGGIYHDLGSIGKALEYDGKALKKFEDINDRVGVAKCLSNLGTCYYTLQDYNKALEYDFKSEALSDEIGDKFTAQIVTGNIGDIYGNLKKYDLALAYYARAMKISEELGDKEGVATAMGGTGHIYLEMVVNSAAPGPSATLDNAIAFLIKSKAVAAEISNLKLMIEINKSLSEAYRLAGRYKHALESYEGYMKLKDSIYSTNNKLKIANLSTQRETDLKNKQIEINALTAKSKRAEQVLYICSIGLLLVVIIIVLRNYRAQKEVNDRLGEEKLKTNSLMGELQQMLRQKDELAMRLEMAADMKSKFLGNISHELRTPVTLLTGMLQLMNEKNGKDRAYNDDQMSVAYNNSRRLQYMLNELLDVTRLEHSKAVVHSEVKEIAPVLKRIVLTFSGLATKDGLILEYADDAPRACAAIDEDKFEKTINNLIFNAIKFNEKGGYIKVLVQLAADRKHLEISVANSGKGIVAGDMERIFERYYQGSGNGANAGGLGIGLALVKEFTLLQGGDVHVTSRPGAGTQFTLRFPLAAETEINKDESDGMAELPACDWEYFAQRQKVLVVEDNAEMRYYLQEILADKVLLVTASNGAEALQWLECNTPDLIISDIMMPEMDGQELIRRIKLNEQFNKIPVITLTALAGMQNQLIMLRMGIDDYIVKPFNASELNVRVYNMLRNNNERKAYIALPAEQEVEDVDNIEADDFRARVTEFVLLRLKSNNVSVHDLDGELTMSERQLYRLAKSLTGCTPAQLVKEVRLQKAYELLTGGGINKIDDLARRVGFENTGYFSRQFLERFGKRPTEFL